MCLEKFMQTSMILSIKKRITMRNVRLLKPFLIHTAKNISSILDLGCGTGNHAIRLALQGYSLTGIDRSNDMLKIAENKAKNKGVHINLHNADIKTYSLNKNLMP